MTKTFVIWFSSEKLPVPVFAENTAKQIKGWKDIGRRQTSRLANNLISGNEGIDCRLQKKTILKLFDNHEALGFGLNCSHRYEEVSIRNIFYLQFSSTCD